jgi:predicted acetyltransferase
MDLTFRTIDEDEFPAFLAANEAAFSAVPTAEDLERERSLNEPDRSFAAFDGERIVGTAGAFTMPMTVPGGELEIGYVTAVGVVPTHRRRGIATALMRRQLDQAHERGELVDVLHASEGGIYGRYGYGLGALGLAIDVDSARSAFVRGYEPSGTIRIVDRDDAVKDLLAVNERTRLERPGMVALDEGRLRYALHDHGPDRELPLLFALHEGDAGVDGHVIYRVTHEWPGSIPDSVLVVRDLQAATPGAYADLWRFVFDIDLTEHVRASNRPSDEPLLHRVRDPRRLRATLRDALWVRLVDVPGALAARRYAAAGRVVLEVRDGFCPWNDGRFLVEADGEAPGEANVTRTAMEPDLVGTASDLGAAYLGGTSLRQLHRAGRVEERTPGALATADAMFAWDPAPWCPYVF